MRHARFRDAERNPRLGAFSRDARVARDDRPTAETLEDDFLPSHLGAPPNRADDGYASSPSSETSTPPLVSALAVSSRLLARLSPLCPAERRAFRHLARAARRLDLVASMRAKRAGTARHLRRAWRFASSASRGDPTAAPALTLLASALVEDADAAETFSRLKRDAREGLRDAAARLRACAANNAWAANAVRGARDEASDAESSFFSERTSPEAAPLFERHRAGVSETLARRLETRFARDAAARLDRLGDTQTRLSERAFAALAGADPRAFAPRAEALAARAARTRAANVSPNGIDASRRSRRATFPGTTRSTNPDAGRAARRAEDRGAKERRAPADPDDVSSRSEPSDAPRSRRAETDAARGRDADLVRGGDAFDDRRVSAVRATQTQSPTR